MEFFKPGLMVDFMRHRRLYALVSTVLVVASIIGIFFPGPNFGTDFVGGTEIQVAFRQPDGSSPMQPDEVRSALEAIGYRSAEVVSVVDRPNEYIIRVRDFSTIDEAQRGRIQQAVEGVLPEGATVERLRVPEGGDSVRIDLSAEMDPAAIERALAGANIVARRVVRVGQSQDHIYEAQLSGVAEELLDGLRQQLGDRGPSDPERIERVGPRAGAQLRDAAIKSFLYAIAFIMVYVAFRFDLRFAPGGIVALFHDALITVGIFVLLQKEFNLTIVAALLTIVGYSINDTIVVYDRIRENLGRYRDKSLYEVINISTSQMLSRTIVTSGTTLLSVSAFFIWGTEAIRDLSFALFIGITVGTYSSIYIAAPVTEWMDRRFFSRSKERAKQTRAAKRQHQEA
jgi:preprotein translocase subunit SecF